MSQGQHESQYESQHEHHINGCILMLGEAISKQGCDKMWKMQGAFPGILSKSTLQTVSAVH